jgi:hypothetical protein
MDDGMLSSYAAALAATIGRSGRVVEEALQTLCAMDLSDEESAAVVAYGLAYGVFFKHPWDPATLRTSLPPL